MESRDRMKLIQYIMEFEKEQLEGKHSKENLVFNNRFDVLYGKSIDFLVKKCKIYSEIF